MSMATGRRLNHQIKAPKAASYCECPPSHRLRANRSCQRRKASRSIFAKSGEERYAGVGRVRLQVERAYLNRVQVTNHKFISRHR